MSAPARDRHDRLDGIDPVIRDGLEYLGLTAYEIRVYNAVLRNPASRVPEIARQSKVPQPKVYATVKRLLERGLLETQLGAVNEYSALQPKDGFLHLVEESKRRQTEASRAIELLQERHEAATDGLTRREGRVKLFQSRPAAARAFHELVRQAQREALVIVRFPLVTADYLDSIRRLAEEEGRARLLCEMKGEPTPEHRDFVQAAQDSGAEVRRLADVPTRMAVFDQKIVALPMSDLVPYQGDGLMMLEVRNRELAQSFAKIYDLLWQQGLDG